MADLKNLFKPLSDNNAASINKLRESAKASEDQSVKMVQDSIKFKAAVDANNDLTKSIVTGIVNNAVNQEGFSIEQDRINAAIKRDLETFRSNGEHQTAEIQKTIQYAQNTVNDGMKIIKDLHEAADSNAVDYQNDLQKAGETSNLIPTTEGLEG